jgi:hypothetical protein
MSPQDGGNTSNTIKNVAIAAAVVGAGYAVWRFRGAILGLLKPLQALWAGISTVAGTAGQAFSAAFGAPATIWAAITSPFKGCSFRPSEAYIDGRPLKLWQDKAEKGLNVPGVEISTALLTWGMVAAATQSSTAEVWRKVDGDSYAASAAGHLGAIDPNVLQGNLLTMIDRCTDLSPPDKLAARQNVGAVATTFFNATFGAGWNIRDHRGH